LRGGKKRFGGDAKQKQKCWGGNTKRGGIQGRKGGEYGEGGIRGGGVMWKTDKGDWRDGRRRVKNLGGTKLCCVGSGVTA